MSKMIQISNFPAAPSTERVPSLAERVASLTYSINLRFLNNRVPALLKTLYCTACMGTAENINNRGDHQAKCGTQKLIGAKP